MLDVAGYREQRQSELKKQADDAVAEVKEHGNAVHLEPMSSYERKIVHDFVAEAGWSASRRVRASAATLWSAPTELRMGSMTDQPEKNSPFPHAGGMLDAEEAARLNPDAEDKQGRTDEQSLREDRAEEFAVQAEEAQADEPHWAVPVLSRSVLHSMRRSGPLRRSSSASVWAWLRSSWTICAAPGSSMVCSGRGRCRGCGHGMCSTVLCSLLSCAGGEVADVGSGAGLPGIALAIARPDVDFLLIEPMERRVQWMDTVVKDLGLDNVRLLRARAEEAVDEVMADVVTARAVSALKKLLPLTVPLLADEGELLLLKGRSAETEIEAATKAISKHKLAKPEILQLGGDLLEEPTTVVRCRRR